MRLSTRQRRTTIEGAITAVVTSVKPVARRLPDVRSMVPALHAHLAPKELFALRTRHRFFKGGIEADDATLFRWAPGVVLGRLVWRSTVGFLNFAADACGLRNLVFFEFGI